MAIGLQGKRSVHRYWVDELQEFNAILSGRFRETSLTTGQVLNRHERREIEAVDYYIKGRNKYKSKYDDYRITGYRHHKLLYLGDWYDVFRYYRYMLDTDMLSTRSGGFVNNRNKLVVYIAINVLGLCSRKIADLMAAETPTIKPWHDAPEEIEKAIERIADNSDFSTMLYGSTLAGGPKGDTIWVVEAYGGEGKKNIRIKRVMPEIWFPDLDPDDTGSIKTHKFAWKVSGTDENCILRQQIYNDYGVIHTANWLNDDEVGRSLSEEEELKFLGSPLPEPFVVDGLTNPLIAHIPNLHFDETHPFGISDYVDVKSMADELAHRMTQLARELDKHANLSMRGPDIAKENTPAGRYFKFMKDEPAPEYITLPTGALDAMMKEVESLIKWVMITLEIAPGLVGLKEGAAPQRAEALRIEANNSVAKSLRKQLYFTVGIQNAFRAAMELENILQIENYKVDGYVGVEWKDGLPDTPTEKAMLAQIRTNAQPTWSQEDAIEYLEGENAPIVLERLGVEKDSMATEFDILEELVPTGEETNAIAAPEGSEEII